MINYVEVGRRIRAARAEKKITQEQFAEMIGVSTGYISQIESGLKCFNLKRFSEVGKILDKPTSYFIEGTEEHNHDYLISEIVEILKGASEDKIRVVKEVVRTIITGEN